MEAKILNYLYQDKIRYAYIIKAIENKLKDFELRRKMDETMSFAAIWHDDQIVTLHGQIEWNQEIYDQYCGIYSFYDIDKTLMEAIYHESPDYVLEHHYLMKLDPMSVKKLDSDLNKGEEGISGRGNSLQSNMPYLIKRGKTVNNTTRYQLLERDGRVLGSVLIEFVAGNVYIISEMLVKKPFRGKGLAYDFLSRLMHQISSSGSAKEEAEFILYVDLKNEPALKLYEKLGFEVVDTFCNLVHND